MSSTTDHEKNNRPKHSGHKAIILAWHTQVALEHASHAAQLAIEIHGSAPIVGLHRASIALFAILSDPAAANDYGPTATADEILRCLLGDLATRAGGFPDDVPPSPILPPVSPLPDSLTGQQAAPPAVVFNQAFLAQTAPEVPQGVLGL
jgi:hypothetical protein